MPSRSRLRSVSVSILWVIPSISFLIAYPTSGSAAGFELASKMASSMHGDVFLAWDNAALGHRVKDCVVQSAKCNTAGNF